MKRNTNLILSHIIWRGWYFFSILLLNILIARFFAAEKSGEIYFIVNNLAFILLVISLSLESGSIFYISSGILNSVSMGRFSFFWAIIASLISIAIWGFIVSITKSYNFLGGGIMMNSFLFILGTLFTTYFTALFYARKEFATPNKILFAVNLCLIAFMLCYKNDSSFKIHFLAIYFFSYFIQGFILLIVFFKNETHKLNTYFPPLATLKKVISYSFTALIANVIYFLVNRIDYWFVEHYCNLSDLGNYIQASKLGQMFLILPSIFASSIFPILSSNKNRNVSEPISFSSRILFWINLLAVLPLIVFGPRLFSLLFGYSFNKMYTLFILLIPGILSITAAYPLTAYNSSRNYISKNIMGALIALVTICTGDLIFLPLTSVNTASIMSSIGYFSYYCFILFSHLRENKLSVTDFFILKKGDFKRIRLQINQLSPGEVGVTNV